MKWSEREIDMDGMDDTHGKEARSGLAGQKHGWNGEAIWAGWMRR
jgi:hypothetical protein